VELTGVARVVEQGKTKFGDFISKERSKVIGK